MPVDQVSQDMLTYEDTLTLDRYAGSAEECPKPALNRVL
jgi:hypothetical protein